MKLQNKLLIAILVIGAVGSSLWQFKLDLLMAAVPKLLAWRQPIGPNIDVPWQKGPEVASKPLSERPPNIILILADDLGFNDVSLYNGGAADGSLKTPSIDALGQDGVRFNHGYAANAVCAPSRASILTGRYSTRFGFEYTPVPSAGPRILRWSSEDSPSPLPSFFFDREGPAREMAEMGMPLSEITIAELLKTRGYHTAHIGKWHLGGSPEFPEMLPTNQGFDESLNMSGMLYLPEDSPQVVNAKIPDQPIERMVWATAQYSSFFNDGPRFEPRGYLTDYYTDEALKVIENHQNEPFFLYLAHWGIHNPLQATREDYDALNHIQDHTLRVYAAMIRSVDRSVRRITQKLQALGLEDNTLVIFTSDNGGAAYIGLPDINAPFRGWKLTHFEGGVHVPFLAKWPDRIDPGSAYDGPVHHNDIFATIATAAGASIPSDRVIDGVNLLPHLRGETDEPPHQTLFWRQGHQQTVLAWPWKLIREGRQNKTWLFNLLVDPNEQTNLAETEADVVKTLNQQLDEHNAQQAIPMWSNFVDSPVLVDKHGEQPYEPGDEYIYWPN